MPSRGPKCCQHKLRAFREAFVLAWDSDALLLGFPSAVSTAACAHWSEGLPSCCVGQGRQTACQGSLATPSPTTPKDASA